MLRWRHFGAVIVFEISDPTQAKYVAYVNNLPKDGDLGPEDLAFIPAADSPTRVNLLEFGNEVSGTATIFQVDDRVELPHQQAQPPVILLAPAALVR